MYIYLIDRKSGKQIPRSIFSKSIFLSYFRIATKFNFANYLQIYSFDKLFTFLIFVLLKEVTFFLIR